MSFFPRKFGVFAIFKVDSLLALSLGLGSCSSAAARTLWLSLCSLASVVLSSLAVALKLVFWSYSAALYVYLL